MTLSLILGLIAAALLAWALRPSRAHASTTVTAAINDPQMLAERRAVLAAEHLRLGRELDLHHAVFEVSSELVGCVAEDDLKDRLGGALARWWRGRALDLLIWEQGTWRGVAGEPAGPPPEPGKPVVLPGTSTGTGSGSDPDSRDLVLDLTPAVAGVALLVLRDAQPQPPLLGLPESTQRAVAETLRGQFALSLRRVVLYRSLHELARSDPLTGTCRRWYAEARLTEQVQADAPGSVLAIDIDLFKRVNDGWGHAAGDRVLAAVGRCLAAWVRHEDLVARMGGEEFLALLPGTNLTGAMAVAERLRLAVAAIDGLPCPITISIGVAERLPGEDANRWVQRADDALYRAKHAGRNRVLGPPG